MTSRVRPAIDDPMARFQAEEDARNAGVKNPITGIREEHDTSQRAQLRAGEADRKTQISKRIVGRLMTDEFGREWLYDLLMSCNVFGTPFTADPITTAYNSGALYIGRRIEDEIKHTAIADYGVMLQEAWERDNLWEEKAAD